MRLPLAGLCVVAVSVTTASCGVGASNDPALDSTPSTTSPEPGSQRYETTHDLYEAVTASGLDCALSSSPALVEGSAEARICRPDSGELAFVIWGGAADREAGNRNYVRHNTDKQFCIVTGRGDDDAGNWTVLNFGDFALCDQLGVSLAGAVQRQEAPPNSRDGYEQALRAEDIPLDTSYGFYTCEVLRAGGLHPGGSGATGPGMAPAQFLVENRGVGHPASQNGRAAILAVERLCPEQQSVLDSALSGNYERARYTAFPDGSFRVGVDIDPGTYRSAPANPAGVITDCYWERSDADGSILDNNFAVGATEIVVTIRPTDAVFTTSGCPTWVRAK